MSDPTRFQVPLTDLEAVHVEQAELVEERAAPRPTHPWSTAMDSTAGGGGPADGDGD